MPSKRLVDWFHAGAAALQLVLPGAPYGYACPLCKMGFLPEALESDQLSLEHAPPKAVGGREVCITCKDCNNTAGFSLDAEMRRREHALDFARGKMTAFRPVRFEANNISVNVRLKREANTISLRGRSQDNDPASYAAFTAWLDEQSRQGSGTPAAFRTTLLLDGFNNQLARVGWLRSAYLLSFAAFGYRWAWQPCLSAVREQLAKPGEMLVPVFDFNLAEDSPNQRWLVIVREPASFRGSLAIAFQRQVIFLPFDRGGIYEHLASAVPRRTLVRLTLSGPQADWPRRPMHFYDTIGNQKPRAG